MLPRQKSITFDIPMLEYSDYLIRCRYYYTRSAVIGTALELLDNYVALNPFAHTVGGIDIINGWTHRIPLSKTSYNIIDKFINNGLARSESHVVRAAIYLLKKKNNVNRYESFVSTFNKRVDEIVNTENFKICA